MTDIEPYLAAGYRFAMHGGKDPAPAAAAELARADLLAEQERLRPLMERCHISRVRSAFIGRVLAIQHPAS